MFGRAIRRWMAAASVWVWVASVAVSAGDGLLSARVAKRGQTCGLSALEALLGKVRGRELSAEGRATKVPAGGFSMKELQELGRGQGLGLTMLEVAQELPVPSIMHCKANHYVAVLEQEGDGVKIYDPLVGKVQIRPKSEVLGQSSGHYLALEAKTLCEARVMSGEEGEAIRGAGGDCYLVDFDAKRDEPSCLQDEQLTQSASDPSSVATADPTSCDDPPACTEPEDPDEEDFCEGGCGMPVWRVSEPFIDLWVKDTPLYYTLSDGKILPFTLRYKQMNTRTHTNVFSVGKQWECSWLAYFDTGPDSGLRYNVAGGGQREYNSMSAGTTVRGSWGESVTMVGSDGSTTYSVTYSTRGRMETDTKREPWPTNEYKFYMMNARIDPYGRAIRFYYETNSGIIRLTKVVDYDGRTNTLAYTNSARPALVTSVSNPYGQTAKLYYDTNDNLTAIVDMLGMSNSFTYNTNRFLTSMVTPYGTTGFQTNVVLSNQGYYQSSALLVTKPGGSKELFLYRALCDEPGLATTVPGSYANVPSLTRVNGNPVFGDSTNFNVWMDRVNTFHWGPKQMEYLSTSTLWTNPPSSFYPYARMRHWGGSSTNEPLSVQLQMQRSPSPDGTTLGHMVWYLYDAGMRMPVTKVELMPGWQYSRYTLWDRGDEGLMGSITTTYATNPGNGLAERTIWYTYDMAPDPPVLQQVWGQEADGTWVEHRSYTRNARHQIVAISNALGEGTTFTYANAPTPGGIATNINVTSVKAPNGTWFTNVLDTNGLVTTRTWRNDSGALATNTFTWDKGKVKTRTDARGLVSTNYWDDLGRLTGSAHAFGNISNVYDKLDLIGHKALDGGWTWRNFNSLRQLVNVTNALQKVTQYTHCSCGALYSVTDPTQKTTTYDYDLRGRMTAVQYPGASHVVHLDWDEIGRATRLWATNQLWLGNQVATNRFEVNIAYNHQGLWTNVTTSAGTLRSAQYDNHDRVVSQTEASGLCVTNLYDLLGRVLARGATNGVEQFGYTANLPEPTSYTNQLGTNVVWLAYDAMGRLKTQTYGIGDGTTSNSVSSTSFGYSAAGDLVSLVDGLSHQTSWAYDQLGRQLRKTNALNALVWTNNYDANGRIIAQWTPTKLVQYTYDAVGNLTNLAYPSSMTISYAYDAANRLTNMIDQLGTTQFGWNEFGALASEDGPWANDKVSYGYNDFRQRSSMALSQPNAADWNQSYGYDTSWRLQSIATPAGSFVYTYKGASSLATNLNLAGIGRITNYFDGVGRLLTNVLVNATNLVLDAHGYVYNPANQQTHHSYKESNYRDFGYDAMGQVVSALGKESGGTQRAQEQFTYGYDAAGNLKSRTNGIIYNFTVDNANRLSAISRTASPFPVAGMATTNVTSVTVDANGGGAVGATLYADKTFVRSGVSLASGNNTFTATASDGSRSETTSVTVNLPALVSPGYDENGNLTSDGVRTFEYDAFNQLTAVQVAGSWRTEFGYDGLGRRRKAVEKVWSAGAWAVASETRYVYDGMVVVQERDGNNVPLISYSRGRDLSGSRQGAGGIGGLLAMSQSAGLGGAHYYYQADSGGNVTALMDGKGQVAARYAYDPYGNLLGMSGPMAEANTYRFSSKEFYAKSGLYYYGFRFYDPNLQRWINKDPLGERGGINLYGYVRNCPVGSVDPLGLVWYDPFSWNWDEIGSAMEFKYGGELGLSLEAKVLGLRGRIGADYGMGHVFNLGGGRYGKNGVYNEAKAGAVVSCGNYDVGFGREWEMQNYGNRELYNDYIFRQKKNEKVVGFHRRNVGADSKDGWATLKVGATIVALHGEIQIDFAAIWDGITR